MFFSNFSLLRQAEAGACYRLAVARQGVETGNICLVFNVWCLQSARPSSYYIDDRQAQATEKKQIT